MPTDNALRTRTITWDDPHTSAAAAREMAGLDFIRAMVAGDLPPPPVARLLDLRIDVIEPGLVVFAFEPAEFHYNPIGSVHGGVIATICDSAMGCALQTLLPARTGYTTIELKTNFLRALTSKSGTVRCEGRVINLGGRTGLTEARLTDSAGRLAAHATSTCLIVT